jgi:uncharacterized membrane protein YeaQ/YmgE (transglycosylase-associated protein family)
MTTILSVSKSFLALIIAIVGAVGALVGTFIPIYVPNTVEAGALVVFVAAVVGGVIVYLTTQEQVAPSP